MLSLGFALVFPNLAMIFSGISVSVFESFSPGAIGWFAICDCYISLEKSFV